MMKAVLFSLRGVSPIATTRQFSIRVNRGKTIAQTITDRTDYASNPEKTRKGELVTGYECSPHTVDAEFLLSKQQYFDQTGRDQGYNNVLAYHIRQAFKPGEVTPELANEIGHELAQRYSKGDFAYIVATHIDKAHVHNHIILNSVNLDCTRKFRDVKQSGKVIRRISDNICFEYGLSVIENPKRSRGHYRSWLGSNKKPSQRDILKATIDNLLNQSPKDFDDLLKMIKASGYEIKRRGNSYSFRKTGKGFITLRSLKEDYSEERLKEIITGNRTGRKKDINSPVYKPQHNNLLVQIQRCVQPKGSPGYDRWAAVFNLKQLAKTFNFLQDNNLLEYYLLEEKAEQAKNDFNIISNRIKDIDLRLSEITALQKSIGSYGKTKETFAKYRKSGWSKKFYNEHKEDIDLHRKTKKAFDELGVEKLPTIKVLQTEYATLLAEKKSLYLKYKQARNFMQEILTVKQNAEKLLSYDGQTKTKNVERV